MLEATTAFSTYKQTQIQSPMKHEVLTCTQRTDQSNEEAAQVEIGENGHFINANRIPMRPN